MNVTRRGDVGETLFSIFVLLVLALGVWGAVYMYHQDRAADAKWHDAMVPVNAATATVGQKIYLGTDRGARSGVILGIEQGGAEKPAKIRVRLPPIERSNGTGTDYTEATFLPTELWVHQ